MKNDLTNIELQALKHIRNFLMHSGGTPSVRELRDALGYKSPRSAAVIIDGLINKGYLERKRTGALRLLKLPPEQEHHAQTVDIPLVGQAAAGLPILAEENIEAYLPTSVRLACPPHRYFFLRVVGDSMNKAGINNGDLALVRQQAVAQDGDRVVALIDDSATIKEFHRVPGAVLLKPRSTNEKHKPIILTEDFQIQGIVTASIPKM